MKRLELFTNFDQRDRFDVHFMRMENDPALKRTATGYADLGLQTNYASFREGYLARMNDEVELAKHGIR